MNVHSFETEDAKQYGVVAATILYNLRFWIEKNAANDHHFYDGRHWTYNSVKAFEELFPYLTTWQIKSSIKKLEDAGAVVTGNYNKSSYDRTRWFSVNSICGDQKHHLMETANGLGENIQPIPDRKPDNKLKKEYSRKRLSYPDDFEDFWKKYPTDKLMSKAETLKEWKKLSDQDKIAATASVAGFVRHCTENPDYRPIHAERYLKFRRFDGFNDYDGDSESTDITSPAAEEEAFEKFMKAYPKSDGKMKAKKCWAIAMKHQTPEKIIRAAKTYAIHKLGRDSEFIKSAAAWLSDRGYDDDLDESFVPAGFWRNPETGELKRTNRG